MIINPIDRNDLIDTLAQMTAHKRETDTLYQNVPCCDYNHNLVIRANVYVKHPRHDGKRLHRIFVGCPECGRLIPFGRIAQHYKIH